MPLTVADIVTTPALALEVLAAGDQQRVVRWVHATEQLDPTPYLHGGEVVLTDGLWLEGADCAAYVHRLAEAGAAALGFGLIDGRPPPPAVLVDACRAHGLTLFAVPVQVPFLAISEQFVENVVHEREEPLRRTVRRSELLLDAVSGDGGAGRVLEVLRAEFETDAWLCDRSDLVLAGAAGNREAPPSDPTPITGGWRRFDVPVPTGTTPATLVLRTGPHPAAVDEDAAIQQTLAVLGIDAAHREALRQTHRRFAAELFDLAREGESEAPRIARRLRDLGIDPDAGLVAIVGDGPGAEAALPAFEHALERIISPAVATVRGGRLLAVAQCDPTGPPPGLGAALSAALGPHAAIGIGTPVAHCALLDASLGDARRACRLAHLRQDGRSDAVAAELTSHAGLLAQQDPDVLAQFCAGLLDPLVEHDAARGSELLPTLAAFLASGGHWQETADRLHVHVNTLRHRLSRVEAITGRRLGDPDDRVDFHLALRARR